jgi:hypothetical protein
MNASAVRFHARKVRSLASVKRGSGDVMAAIELVPKDDGQIVRSADD